MMEASLRDVFFSLGLFALLCCASLLGYLQWKYGRHFRPPLSNLFDNPTLFEKRAPKIIVVALIFSAIFFALGFSFSP